MLRTLTTTCPNRASSAVTLPRPNLTATFSVPFTRQSLAAIRAALIAAARDHSPVAVDPKEKHAAVLIPLCNVNDQPGILLELRGKLRTHSGEVRFVPPFIITFQLSGGKGGPDRTFLAAALRETQEEIGISPDQVEILGQVGSPQLSLGGLRVWPYVGFVHPTPQIRRNEPDDDPVSPLPSLPMDCLTPSLSEVATIFHLSLAAAATPARLHVHYFRGKEPYWAVEVSDLIKGTPQTELGRASGDGSEERVEVWGLTGWYLFLFMKALKLYD